MKSEILRRKTEWKVCAKCGHHYSANLEECDHCALPRSKPEFIAGLITAFIGILAFYFIFQL